MDEPIEVPLVYTVPEVARMLRVCENTIWGLIREAKLPVLRMGRRAVVPRDALMNWINEETR